MRTESSKPIISWQQTLAQGFNHPHELLNFLEIPLGSIKLSASAHQQFKTKVPLSFAAKMKAGDREDPLLRQVLPLYEEELDIAGFSNDPLNESLVNPSKGLLHKYHGRVLLT